MDLPKGASSLVDEAGLRLVKLHKVEILDKVAKKHFKITRRILASLEE
jgi:ribonuclease HIII